MLACIEQKPNKETLTKAKLLKDIQQTGPLNQAKGLGHVHQGLVLVNHMFQL